MDVLHHLWNSVVMEAKKDDEKDEDQEPEASDYTEDDPDTGEEEPANDAGNDTEDDDIETTDYTIDDDEIGGDDEGDTGDEPSAEDDAGDESTDYTGDEPDTGEEEPATDDTGDNTGEDAGGDDTTTIDAGDPDDNPDAGGDDTSNDYTADADPAAGDDTASGDGAGGDENEPTLDTGEGGGATDYTSDDAGGDDAGGVDTGGDDSGDSGDDSSSDSSSDDDTPKNDKLRKYYLLRDFGNLQTFIQDAIEKLTEKHRESFVDKQVDMQCVINFNKLLSAISDYMVFKFDDDDYVTAFYNYKRFEVLVNINIELLSKRKEIATKELGKKKNQTE